MYQYKIHRNATYSKLQLAKFAPSHHSNITNYSVTIG